MNSPTIIEYKCEKTVVVGFGFCDVIHISCESVGELEKVLLNVNNDLQNIVHWIVTNI